MPGVGGTTSEARNVRQMCIADLRDRVRAGRGPARPGHHAGDGTRISGRARVGGGGNPGVVIRRSRGRRAALRRTPPHAGACRPQTKYVFAIDAPIVYFGSTMLPSRTLPHIVSSM